MFDLSRIMMLLLTSVLPTSISNAAAFTSALHTKGLFSRSTRRFRSTSSLLQVTPPPEFYYDISKLPCNNGKVQVARKDKTYNIAYKIVRPMSLSSRQAKPVVVVHGGPSLPSDYLYTLARVVPYRSIVFYDQLGCGMSDQPNDVSCYSMDQAVSDLQVLVKKLSLRQFHLYGQSFGGCLAYEYLRRRCSSEPRDGGGADGADECLSVVLSSAPTSIAATNAEYDRLFNLLGNDNDLFRKTHQCRTPEFPKPLQAAYDKVGRVWGGTGVVADYVAKPPSSNNNNNNNNNAGSHTMPSCLVLHGEYDFVTTSNNDDDAPLWKDVLVNSNSVRQKVLPNCSHHGLLEDPVTYGEILESFFAEYD